MCDNWMLLYGPLLTIIQVLIIFLIGGEDLVQDTLEITLLILKISIVLVLLSLIPLTLWYRVINLWMNY